MQCSGLHSLLLLLSILSLAFSAMYVYGPLDGLTCNSETVQSANTAQLHSILSELADTTFFRLVRIDIDGYCPIDELRPKAQPQHASGALAASTCGTVVDTFASFAPASAMTTSTMHTSSYGGLTSPPEPSSGESLCSVHAEDSHQQVAETVVKSISAEEVSAQIEFPRDNDCMIEGTFQIRPDFWLDLCNSSSSQHYEHVNLKVNPERNTGYNGSVIWQEMHRTIASLDSPEGHILQRLLSGYHASVATQIMWSYFPPKGKETKWRPNFNKFATQIFLPHVDHIKNMQFAFVVIARSLFKLKDHLYAYPYTTGNATADLDTKQLMHQLLGSSALSSCDQVFSAFDESVMFSRLEHRDVVAKEFKKLFRMVSGMVHCVTCHRCKLHATVAMHGIGMAIKVLLTPLPLVVESLTRDDIVALINALYKFSESITLSNELMAMHYASVAAERSSAIMMQMSNTSDIRTTQQPSVDDELAFIAQHRANLTRLQEDALVNALVNRHEPLMTLRKHFQGWSFVRHALIALKIEQPDAVVVGGGLAGLVAAVSIADRGGSVIIIEKQGSLGGNSAKASSGINSALGNDTGSDDRELFFQDTIKSQNHLGDLRLARELVERANASVSWLEQVTGLDLSAVGQLGGHTVARTHRPWNGVVGAEIMAALIKQTKNRFPSIKVLTHATATQLLTDDLGRVYGVEYIQKSTTASNTQQSKQQQLAQSVILASGGFGFDAQGMLKEYRPDLVSFPTTLGPHTTGDGIRLATQLGAELVDMQYVQLHPTGFIDPADREAHTKVLGAELLRGIGGVLLDKTTGKRFANELGTRKHVTDKMLELSSDHINNSSRTFWLVLSDKSVALEPRLTTIYTSRGLLRKVGASDLKALVGAGVMDTLREYSDLSIKDEFGRLDKRGIPMDDCEYWLVGEVTPVVHYTMGGVKIDERGRVLRGHRDGNQSSDATQIEGLYAVGEVSGGVHGENRLGGNSLLECTVFGRIIGDESVYINKELALSHFPKWEDSAASKLLPMSSSSGGNVIKDLPRLSLTEVARHGTADNCYTVIDGKIYDLSGYAPDHPGGEQAIAHSCGVDATERFMSAHSLSLLADVEFEPIGVLLVTSS